MGRVVRCVVICFIAALMGYFLRWYADYRENRAAMAALAEAREHALLAWEMQTAHQPPVPPGEIEPGTAKQGDLRLIVSTTKPAYAVGEEVMIRVVLANASLNPMLVPVGLSMPSLYLHIEITRDGVELLPPVGPDYAACARQKGSVPLLPRETYGFVDSISSGWHGFDLSQPGSYSLGASYTVFVGEANWERDAWSQQSGHCYPEPYVWSGTVAAALVKFTVVPE